MFRRALLFLLLVSGLLLNDAVAAAPCWPPPLIAPVTDPFRAPSCPYCAGNRGIEFATMPGDAVRAVQAGTVSWAGTIAGVRWVVVLHADGQRTTYGRLASSSVATGDRVATGRPVGTTTSSFYFGLRDGERYVDPTPFLGHLVGRPRLVPVDGTSARPSPPPRLSCRAVRVVRVRPR